MTSRAASIYGTDALERLARQIDADGVRRILLVTGRASFEHSGAAAGLAPLAEFSAVERWHDFRPNPSIDDLANGLQVMRSFAPDAVLGIGGGSVMDMAKLLVAFESVPTDEVAAAVGAGARPEQRSTRLYLAPTTSGSGSEATHFAVAYIGDDKYSVAGSALRADRIALDPRLAMAGSPHQRATSGFDAICQAIESSWAVGSTADSRRLARHALGFLVPAIERFVADADETSARAMQIGSYLAGRAIDISKTTAAHALSYAITKRYGVDHGSAVALTLGYFIEVHAAPDVRLQPAISPVAHRAAMATVLGALGAEDGRSARHNFYDLVARVGLPTELSAVGVRGADELIGIARSVNVERLGNNPAVHDETDLVAVLEHALGDASGR